MSLCYESLSTDWKFPFVKSNNTKNGRIRTLAVAGLALVAFTAPGFAQQSPAPSFSPTPNASPAPVPKFKSYDTMSAQERSDWISEKLAVVKTGLKLTPEQEALWPAAETGAKAAIKALDAIAASHIGAPPSSPW